MARDTQAQIAAAQKELASLLPWVDLRDAQWRTLRIERAEPAQSGLVRPDNAYLHVQGNLLVGWPTKLALAPDLADRVLANLQASGVEPSGRTTLTEHPQPPLGRAPWQELF